MSDIKALKKFETVNQIPGKKIFSWVYYQI